jgi:hypothetical protein
MMLLMDWHGSRVARWLVALFIAALAGGCGEDDEDRIDKFVEAVTGEMSSERVDHVLSTYLDLDDRPLSTTVFGDMHLYRAEDEQQLKQLARSRLQRISGSSLKALRRQVEIKGETARVDLQLLGDGMMGNVSYELYKRGERWFLSAVRITR